MILVVLLTGCGVDGAPQRPVDPMVQQQVGISYSGSARVGVSANL